jgi:hypothetical protein
MQISEPTLKRRIKEHGLSRESYFNISDNDVADLINFKILHGVFSSMGSSE